MSSEKETHQPLSFNEIINKSAASAVRGGTAGAVAMGANVAALMWLRTTVCVLLLGFWFVFMFRFALFGCFSLARSFKFLSLFLTRTNNTIIIVSYE